MTSHVKELIRLAAEAAKEAPESLREVAFQKAFDLLSQGKHDLADQPVMKPAAPPNASQPKRRKTAGHTRQKTADAGRAQIVLDIVEAINGHDKLDLISKVVLDGRSQANRVLLCFYMADQLGKPDLGTGEVETITRQLGVRLAQPNVSKAIRTQLRRALTPNSIRRQGQRVTYRINRNGKVELEKLLAEKPLK